MPPELAAVVHKCLAKSPDDRYLLPMDVAAALAPWGSETPILPEPQWVPQRRRGMSLTDSRLVPKKPGIESTMLPPISKHSIARGSNLFAMTKTRAPEVHLPTVADLGEETPRRWPLPEKKLPTRASVLRSHVYVPESDVDKEVPKTVIVERNNSPLLFAILLAVLALLGVGIALLVKGI